MNLYNFTDSEINTLLDSMVILIDTREKSIKHITQYFENKEISFKRKKLSHGDFTAMIPANEKLGIMRDLYFGNIVSVERKANLNELSGNFTRDRTRLENEFIRGCGTIRLLVEHAGYEDLVSGNYNTKYNSKSFVASLKAFECRYNFTTAFVRSKRYSGNWIYHTIRYSVREYLKNGKVAA